MREASKCSCVLARLKILNQDDDGAAAMAVAEVAAAEQANKAAAQATEQAHRLALQAAAEFSGDPGYWGRIVKDIVHSFWPELQKKFE